MLCRLHLITTCDCLQVGAGNEKRKKINPFQCCQRKRDDEATVHGLEISLFNETSYNQRSQKLRQGAKLHGGATGCATAVVTTMLLIS